MKIKTVMRYVMIVAVLMFAIEQAQATSYNISVTGNVADVTTFGGPTYDGYDFPLTVVPQPTGGYLTVNQNDTVNATVTLNQPFTIPAAIDSGTLVFGMWGDNFPSGGSNTSDTISFYNGATIVGGPWGGGSSSGGWIAAGVNYPSMPLTFDSVTDDFTIINLGGPATLQYAEMYFYLWKPGLPAPAPEPTTMLLLGLGLVGLAGVRRKFQQ